MIGAIAGDVIGSAYESAGSKQYDFDLFSQWSRFTDDTVCTIAVARALLEDKDYGEALRELCKQHPHAGYGAMFGRWIVSPDMGPYNSWGNGAAMRVSPIGFAGDSVEWVLAEAERSAAVTHDHPEGVKGAQATALCIYLARQGVGKDEIRGEISERFGYDLDRSVEALRPTYNFDVAAEFSVPESIISFLDAENYEGTIRNAVSLGGDADTMACIAGGIAEAFWGPIPVSIAIETGARLPEDFLQTIDRFGAKYDLEG